MTTPPPLEPDEILTADGVRVQLRRPPGSSPPRRDRWPASTRLLALAAAPVVVPVAAAGVACLVGVGVAAAGVGLARQLLGALPSDAHPDAWTGGSVTVLRVDIVVLEVRS